MPATVFESLLRGFEKRNEAAEGCQAQLFVDGLATSVIVLYSRDGMEIRGLPGDLPALIRVEQDGVRLGTDGVSPSNPDDAEFFELYRMWDPRALARAMFNEAEVAPGKWRAICSLRDVIAVPQDVYARLPVDMTFEYTDEAGGRLRQMSFPDLAVTDRKLTLVFDY